MLHRPDVIFVPDIWATVGKNAALVAGALQAALRGVDNPESVIVGYTPADIATVVPLLKAEQAANGLRRLMAAGIIVPVERVGRKLPTKYTVNLPPFNQCISPMIADNMRAVGHDAPSQWVGTAVEVRK